MKKLLSLILVTAALMFSVFGAGTGIAYADESITTIQGTVTTGSTASIVKVKTSEGTYEIKIDSDTQFLEGKNLLPGRNVTVSLKHGNDAYLHAVSVKDGGTGGITIDRSNVSEVSGKIKDVDTKNIIYFELSNGEMQVKLDDTTDLSGTKFLVAGNTYTMKVARGSDAYMHALSISDSYSSSSSSSVSTSSSSSYIYNDNATLSGETYSCSGTVGSGTKLDVLYLNCSDGERQLKIDASTDTSKGFVQVPGTKLSVTYRYGSDAYWHAVTIEGATASSSGASVESSNPTTVTGTVTGKTTADKLYLDVSNGTMEIKLDTLKSLDGIKVLNQGRKVTVKIGYGSDAYWHALSISG